MPTPSFELIREKANHQFQTLNCKKCEGHEFKLLKTDQGEWEVECTNCDETCTLSEVMNGE